MFNGIIFNTGRVQVIKKKKNSIYVGIQTKINFSNKDLGSSVCCDGVCLTVDKVVKRKIFFYISNETLKRSNFKSLKLNQVINLEKSSSIKLYERKFSFFFKICSLSFFRFTS